MPTLSVAVDTTTGRLAPAVGSSGNLSGTAGEALAIGDVLYVKASDGKLYKHAGTEVQAQAIVGICDGTYALNATAGYWGEGQVATGLSGLTIGDELWAKENGRMSTYASVTSSNWTRPLAVAKTTTTAEIRLGDVRQKP